MTTLLYLLATLLCVLANAFFVASEYSVVKVRPTRLEQIARSGDGRAKLALRIQRHLDEYLSAHQLGVTLASLGLGWVGEPAIADEIAPWLVPLGRFAGVAGHTIALVIAFLLITAVHTIVGELAPKALAIQKTEQVALFTATPIHVFYVVMWPLIWGLNKGANAFVRLFGLKAAASEDIAHTSEELRMLLTRSPAGLDPTLREMLVRIFDLRRRTARHVMSLRSEAATMRADWTIEAAVKVATKEGYSRYPVLDEDQHGVLGYLHLRDLFEVLAGTRKATRVAELLRKPLYARESTSVERLRLEMQAKQIPVAMVLADDGEFIGLVTIEDLLEEIVGEIRDENDEEVAPIHRRGGGIVDVDGRVLLVDLERDVNIVLRPEVKHMETVGGYILARLSRPAQANERVECEGYTLVAVDVVGRRVRRVRIVPTGSERPPPKAE
jgi:CBS domain containing-hemolysin-like protein